MKTSEYREDRAKMIATVLAIFISLAFSLIWIRLTF